MMELIEKKPAKPENSKGSQPRYVLLAEALRLQILNRELAAGDRLPSFAEFRSQHGVTLTTTEKVYSLLEQEGLIERRHGVGTFVAQPKQSFTGNIGFIGSLQSKRQRDPFTAHIMEGVQQALEEHERHLLYMGTNHVLNWRVGDKVDGVLICNIDDPTPVLQQLPATMPRVSLVIAVPGITSVVPDDQSGAKLAVRHLLEAGHRRIACLMERLPSIARRRTAGYYDGMLEAGIEPEADWVRLTKTVPGKVENEQPYLVWARGQMRDWLKEGWRELGCTAIVVQNEVAAIGVMQILQEEGIQVPQQVSVIGFDGTEICDLVVPRLTVVDVPLTELGAKSIEVLVRQIAGEGLDEQVIALPMKLRAGDSVASPPGDSK